MPMHDWTRVEAGIYHDFHHEWISAIKKSLNKGLLNSGYYAMAEQHAAGFGPDVLTLQSVDPQSDELSAGGVATLTKPKPKSSFYAETPSQFYQRKKSSLVVRHISGDRIVAMIEIISPGNKGSQYAFQSLVDKASKLIRAQVHLLILDPFPPTVRDPNGIHAAIWATIDDSSTFEGSTEKPLTMVAYEADENGTCAYIEPIAVGDTLPEMPLFLEPRDYVMVPLEATYEAAWDTVPPRWQKVISP
jgi:hypothetical protein